MFSDRNPDYHPDDWNSNIQLQHKQTAVDLSAALEATPLLADEEPILIAEPDDLQMPSYIPKELWMTGILPELNPETLIRLAQTSSAMHECVYTHLANDPEFSEMLDALIVTCNTDIDRLNQEIQDLSIFAANERDILIKIAFCFMGSVTAALGITILPLKHDVDFEPHGRWNPKTWETLVPDKIRSLSDLLAYFFITCDNEAERQANRASLIFFVSGISMLAPVVVHDVYKRIKRRNKRIERQTITGRLNDIQTIQDALQPYTGTTVSAMTLFHPLQKTEPADNCKHLTQQEKPNINRQ